MKTLRVLVLLLVLGCAGTDPAGNQGDTDKSANRAFTEAEWKAEVLDANEPVLVDFWAPWCGPCLGMKPTLKSLAKEHRVVQVNVDENKKLKEQYDIEVLPTLLIFKDGTIVTRYMGVTSEEALRKGLERASAK
jgi:thioredoxin 1